MHEMSIVSGILESARQPVEDSGASRVLEIHLRIGDLTQVVEEALEFAFEALAENTVFEGAHVSVERISPRSQCNNCGTRFSHDCFHRSCTSCGSSDTMIIAGREIEIASIEVETDD